MTMRTYTETNAHGETVQVTETDSGHVIRELKRDPLPLQPEPRHISVGAFFDRFGPAKWAILADGAPAVQAVVKDSSVRKYIDLDSPDLPMGLAIVQSAGHAIDPEAVLTSPILDNERP